MIRWRRERTAFAISGGGARGAIQVGMLKALLEQGIKPDFIVGTSVGAWNGGWLAQGASVERIEQLARVWRNVNSRTLNVIWWRAARNLVRRRPSLYPGDGMTRLIAANISRQTFADLDIQFHAVAIDLTEGRKAVFSSGPLAPAVLASSAIPGMFPPVLIDGRQYVDGGGVDPTGLETAVELGAKKIYVLNCGYSGRLQSPLRSMNTIMDHAFQVAAQHRIESTIRDLARYAEIVHLRPNAGFLKHSMDFTLTEQYLEAGYRYVWEVLGGNRRGRRVAGVSPAAVPSPAPATA
jgi:NTE family protein